MTRIARYTIQNGIYHVMSRGNNKDDVFLTDDDRHLFLRFLSKYKDKYSIAFYHFVLMPNHYHLVITAPTGAALSSFMKCINVCYAGYFRKVYGGIGHVWQDRFKSILVESGRYLLECGRYVEYNPIKRGLVKDLLKYPWSSYLFYQKTMYANLITPNPEFEALAESASERRKIYRDYVYRGSEEKRDDERLFRDAIYGSTAFKHFLQAMGIKGRRYQCGRPRKK